MGSSGTTIVGLIINLPSILIMLRTLEFFSLLYASRALLCDEALCPKEWVSFTQRGDSFCDLECMNGPCGYDGATDTFATSDCRDKSTVCNYLEEADNTCNEEYSVQVCGWDMGDCGYCAEGCMHHTGFQESLSNGVCEEQCNTATCGFDGGDCVRATQGDCASGCFASMLGNGICETECFHTECFYDRGDCELELCTPGCFPEMLGNNMCDDACNSAECSDDNGDCDCAPGCTFLLLNNSECDEPCANFPCAFDSHTCVTDTQGDCGVGCFERMIGDGNCDPACNSAECRWDELDCGCAAGCNFEDIGTCKYECTSAQCNYGLDTAQLQSFTCDNAIDYGEIGFYAALPCETAAEVVRMNCCEDCCGVMHPSEINPEVCVRSPDTSSAAAPQVLYVSPSATEALADCSEANACTLRSAFIRLYQAYTTMLLLPGEHYIEYSGYYIGNTEAIYEGPPLLPITKLVITAFSCVAEAYTCERVTLVYAEVYSYFNFDFIHSVEISHVNFYSPLPPIDCLYCSFYLNLFTIMENNELKLTHVAFRHFNKLLGSVVRIEHASLTLTDVDFEDVAALSELSAVINGHTSAVITYNGGSVKLLNNGLRYNFGSNFFGFLICENTALTVRNVTFSHNFAETANPTMNSQVSLLLIGVCQPCLFQNCVFRNNIANSIIHYQGNLLISPVGADIVEKEKDLIEIVDCVFVNNTATFGTVFFFSTTHLPDVTIRNCTFTNELSATYGVIAIQVPKRALRSAKSWKIVDFGEHRAKVNISLASATLASLRFVNCTVTQFGVIAVSNFPQLLLSGIEVDSSGAFQGANRYSNTLRDFENFGGSLPDNIPPVPSADCTSLLNFTSVRNLTITAFRSNPAKCALRVLASGDFLTLSHSVFISSSPSEGTLLQLQFSQSVSVSSTIFHQIWCANGTIVATGASIYLDACSFQECTKAVVMQNINSVVVEHSAFERGQGSVLALSLGSRTMHYWKISECLFEDNQAVDSSMIKLLANRDNVQIAFLLIKSRFQYNQVPLGSALLFLQKLTFTDESEISFCEFRNNSISTLYMISIAGSLRINDCIFANNIGGVVFCECSQLCTIDLRTLSFSGNAGVVVTFRSSIAVASDLHFRSNQGVCFLLTSTELAAHSLSFSENAAKAGTALTLSASRAALTNTTFHSNSAKTNGGAVLVQAGSEFNCSVCAFEGLSATLGGAVFAKYESVVHLSSSRFVGNTARDGFAVLLASSKLPSFIVDCEIQGNAGEGSGVISLMNAALVLSSTALHNNTSAAYSAGLVLQLASVLITNCEFSDQRSASGCFLYASHGDVRAEHSRFSAGVATASGGAVLASETSLAVENCTFTRLTALTGGALSLQSSSSISLKDCDFFEIVTESSGRGVIEVSDSSLHLSGVYFEQFRESAIVGESITLTVEYSEFAGNERATTGGGIACEACSSVTIASSLFTHLKADTGSAVYLHSEVDSSTSHWEISNCVFSANTASTAATVWLKGTRTAVSNNLFSENNAGKFGGGLALFALTSELHNNSFVSNRAYEGAAIYWRGSQPVITHNLCVENVAVYGDCVASFAVALKVEKNSTLTGLPSGQVSTGGISILLVDHYGKTVSSDSSSDGWLTSEVNGTAVTGVTHTKADRGRLLFSDFAVVAQPKSTASLSIYTSALSSSHPLSVEMRDCVQGEMLSNLQCVVCEAGTYSLDPSEPCKKCPSEAICLGNFTLTPRPGYWRLNEYTDHFFRCPNQDSCLGSPGPTTNLTGECEEGYEGNKCQSCSVGYYRWGKVSCAKCPSPGAQVAVRLSIIVFVSTIGVLIIRSALQQRGLHSAYAKVYVNYLQLVMLLGSFHLQWPYLMMQLFNAQESVGGFLEIAFSLRCLWSDETESETYFHELIMFSLFPPVLVALCCSVWVLTSLFRQVLDFRSKMLGSAIVLYFLAYPSVIRVMASAWTFEEIGPGELWVVGLQQRALTGHHLKYAVGLALPCGVLYGVLIPLALALVLKQSTKSKQFRLGFFTQAYRPEMYYWKFVTILRVTLVVACIPLFSRVSAAYQVLSALAVLSGSLLLHRTCRPFADHTFNVLESRALVIVITTLYAGLFFYAAKLSAVTEMMLSAFMIAVNAYFSVTCWRNSIVTLLFRVANNISKWIKTRSISRSSDFHK